MRTVDMFPAEAHVGSTIYPSCRVRVENGHARVWRWLNGEAVLVFDGRVTLAELEDHTPHRDVAAKGKVRALHPVVDDKTDRLSAVAFSATSGGCECGGSWNLRMIPGVPAL